MLTVGSMFSGVGGLDLAVCDVLGASVAWHSEVDPAASKVLAHHWPDVPNLGDVTTVDWSTVPRVDVLTGGFPCQDVSHAGLRAGIRPGTRSGLWTQMAYAIGQLRPALVVIENVRGLLSAEAASDVEPCPWCLGDAADEPPLRALGAVLGDLAQLGYDAEWAGVRASDVGAAHQRFRVFIVAHPADADLPRWEGREPARGHDMPAGGDRGALSLLKTPTAQLGVNGGSQHPDKRRAGGHGPTLADQVEHLLPTPKASDGPNGGPGMRNGKGAVDALPGVVALLPTPAVNDMGAGKTPEDWDAWTERMRAEHGNGNGHGKSLAIEALRMLPTPTTTQRGTDANLHEQEGAMANLHNTVVDLLPPPAATDAKGARNATSGRRAGSEHHSGTTLGDVAFLGNWGQYAPAIARWERVLGRPAPEPTEPTGKHGRPRLSRRFTEWHMGLPDGHVTAVDGLTYSDTLKALGNGVVPLQAAYALRWLLSMRVAA